MAYKSSAMGRVDHNDRLVEPTRGDIFYVTDAGAFGHEIGKTRPAVIISADEYNRNKPCVVVLFTSSSAQSEENCHVRIRSTPKVSTVICEQPTTVDKARLGTWLGRATEGEMSLLVSSLLGVLNVGTASAQRNCMASEQNEQVSDATATIRKLEKRAQAAEEKLDKVEAMASDNHHIRVEAERDTYKALYRELLDMATGRRAEG